jgi:ubiquinone/menaquinone biosynthesis C-methylase UbiE
LAPIYDSLARLVIGKGIRSSQLHFLHHLIQKQKLLILGGGTGWILPFIFEINPMLHIDYIELSPKMLDKAKLNAKQNQNIRFIEGTERSVQNEKYDCVLTNFYLDLFSDEELCIVIDQIKEHLQPNTSWLATDFVSEKKRHRVMLWVMYRFFSMATGLKTSLLPKWKTSLKNAGGKLVESKKSSRGFIESTVFQF